MQAGLTRLAILVGWSACCVLAGWKLAQGRHERTEALGAARVSAGVVKRSQKADRVAGRYAEWLDEQSKRKGAADAVARDAIESDSGWADGPMPDGVRSAIEAAAAARVQGAGLTGGALPGASASPAGEQ